MVSIVTCNLNGCVLNVRWDASEEWDIPNCMVIVYPGHRSYILSEEEKVKPGYRCSQYNKEYVINAFVRNQISIEPEEFLAIYKRGFPRTG